ncbi:hypothetical protein [Sphingomonas abietis]|uniref:Uncharacterized protein n=1 Tax=Sphingomonas abietis TaxID=3012344 RepID=A0ABY7NYB5_9SPHN|nr:hypothetical protein [Sphingomonas abietis]WBO24351.1 hypothetical protein PBT88_09735 [Sphingomonas abietis]
MFDERKVGGAWTTIAQAIHQSGWFLHGATCDPSAPDSAGMSLSCQQDSGD